MRTLVLIISLFLFNHIGLSAQILEKESNMSLGVQTGNEVILTEIEAKDAAKLWGTYFKDEYDEKVKRNRKADEYYTTGARINSIFSVSKIDVYSKFEERGSNTVMTLWIDLGMAFVNAADYPTEYQGVLDLMEDFRVFARKFVVNEEFEAAEKELDKMKKDLDKLEKKNGRLHEKVADYETKIVDTKSEIEQNLIDQEENRISIDQQIEMLKQIQIRLESIKKGN